MFASINVKCTDKVTSDKTMSGNYIQSWMPEYRGEAEKL